MPPEAQRCSLWDGVQPSQGGESCEVVQFLYTCAVPETVCVKTVDSSRKLCVVILIMINSFVN